MATNRNEHTGETEDQASTPDSLQQKKEEEKKKRGLKRETQKLNEKKKIGKKEGNRGQHEKMKTRNKTASQPLSMAAHNAIQPTSEAATILGFERPYCTSRGIAAVYRLFIISDDSSTLTVIIAPVPKLRNPKTNLKKYS